MPSYSNEEDAYIKWLSMVEKDLKDFDNLRSVKPIPPDRDLLKQEDVKGINKAL
jgi:hypothetical protein